MLKNLIIKNRTIRRFCQNETIDIDLLRGFVDLARLGPSARNAQPLKYIIVNDAKTNAEVFANLAWAGDLKDWAGPEEGERPAAYIIILGDTAISNNFYVDHGIAAQTIKLAAAEQGLGGCILAAINKTNLRAALKIPEQYEILLVLALGKPKETVVLEKVKDNNVKYWRDDKDVHHVPKRSLDDVILNRL